MAVDKKERPDLEVKVEGNNVRLAWGPPKGLWGRFKEHADPVEVTIDEWFVYVWPKNEKFVPGHGATHMIFEKVGTKTQITIPIDKPSLHKKTLAAEVLGLFNSEKPDGEKFREGIYTDIVEFEMD